MEKHYTVAIIDASTACLYVEQFSPKRGEDIEELMDAFITQRGGHWGDCSWGVIKDMSINLRA